MARIGRRVLDIIVPDELDGGPETGTWRRELLADRADDCLFHTILVPVSGNESGWVALEAAHEVARREGAEIHGLHVVADKKELEAETPKMAAIRDRFYWRRGEVSFRGDFHFRAGSIVRNIAERARWVDLVVVKVDFPPEPGLLGRLTSNFRTLVRLSSRPILAIPGDSSPLSKPMLAYDASPKAREALFIATYLSGAWNLPLSVVSVSEDEATNTKNLEEARLYLEEHGLTADYISAAGPVAETILQTAEHARCDWLIIGGYNLSPLVEAVLGTVLNQVIHEAKIPLLICQ
jgi:nucleotide-binding universal stress UspA family protein